MFKRLQFTPRKIAYWLLAIVAFLLLANLVSIYFKFVLNQDYGFTRTFYFNTEANIPSFYSALSMVMSSVILFFIGNLEMRIDKTQARCWKLLGYVFLFLSIDEFISIHENLTGMTRNIVGDGGGYFYYAWVIPYVVVFGIIFVYLIRFFFRLPVRLRVQFAIAGTIFLTGAVAMEVIGGRYAFHNGTANLNYALLVTGEELLEMLGIIVFNYSLLKYFIKELINHQMNFNIEIVADVPVYKIVGVKVPPFLH
jgi:hypothetical protein